MQIQHADNISNKKNNHDTFNINSDAKYMSEFSAMIK